MSTTAVPPPRPELQPEPGKPKPGFFPLGYKEGFSQWWSAPSPAAAEARVLQFLPFNSPSPAVSSSDPHTVSTNLPSHDDPYGPRECTSTLVELSGKNRAINELSITRTGESEPVNNLVVVHGYGAGLGFFYRNFDALSRRPGWKIYALDLLGYGRSSRPQFCLKSKTRSGKITEAEDFFIDALEEWRQIRGIERFTLIGHSFGGYMSMRYTLKYKDRVNKLIMASAVGVPVDEIAIADELPDTEVGGGGISTLANEFTQAQDDITINERPGSLSFPATQSEPVTRTGSPKSINEIENTSPAPRRPLPKWLMYLWDANVSPFSFVRWSGPLGPRLISAWTSRRFSSLPKEESTALHDYAYSLFRQKGSGEYALPIILAPGAYARRPLLWRVQDLVSKVGKFSVPSVWMYGSVDWMDVAGGFAAEEKIRNTALPCDDSTYIGGPEWRGDKVGRGGEAKVLIVPDAGHHLYLDNAKVWNGMILKEMEDVEMRERLRSTTP